MRCYVCGLILLGWSALAIPSRGPERSVFEGHGDVGQARRPGSMLFDPGKGEYRVTGSGENMWGAKDAFHFAWRRLSGNLLLSAELSFPEREGDAHRKAGWMVRSGLEAHAPYADSVVHADGLISLQYRLVRGGPTREVRSPVRTPAAIRLERTGDLFSLSVARDGKAFQPVGSVTLANSSPRSRWCSAKL